MLYFQGYTISFQEVPDEISLVLLIADCPYRCPGCHSPNLQKPSGKDIESELMPLMDKFGKYISCVCLMGDGQDEDALFRCADRIRSLGLKAALYTGSNDLYKYYKHFDYVKYGPYIEECGGLDNPDTNQRMIKITRKDTGFSLEDITSTFWKKNYLM